MERSHQHSVLRILFLCAALTMLLCPACLAERAGDFTCVPLEGGGAEITGWTGEGTTLEIPAELDGLPVASIGAGALAGCERLEAVTLPEGLEALGDGAFADCYSLEAIRIPATVARVGQNPFAGCENLKKLDLAEGGSALAVVNGVLFAEEGRRLVFCPRVLPMERYTVPEGTERVDARAFSHCTKLLSVTLPDSVTEIGEDAFEGRVNLTLVVGRDSYAERYARDNKIKYTYPDAAEWLAD